MVLASLAIIFEVLNSDKLRKWNFLFIAIQSAVETIVMSSKAILAMCSFLWFVPHVSDDSKMNQSEKLLFVSSIGKFLEAIKNTGAGLCLLGLICDRYNQGKLKEGCTKTKVRIHKEVKSPIRKQPYLFILLSSSLV